MLEIVYEDDYLIAINKPTGLLVHRSSIATNTKEFAVQQLRNQTGEKVFPIHRLDRKTSGVLLFAKTAELVAPFQLALQQMDCVKTYWAIVRGYFPDAITVDYPLTNDKGKTQDAITHFYALAKSEIPLASGKHATSRYSWVVAQPLTGRMHQIRKHCNHLRHPIIGDRPHGCNKQNKLFLEKWGLSEMLLHARAIEFDHPFKQQRLCIEAPCFPTFHQYLKELLLVGA